MTKQNLEIYSKRHGSLFDDVLILVGSVLLCYWVQFRQSALWVFCTLYSTLFEHCSSALWDFLSALDTGPVPKHWYLIQRHTLMISSRYRLVGQKGSFLRRQYWICSDILMIFGIVVSLLLSTNRGLFPPLCRESYCVLLVCACHCNQFPKRWSKRWSAISLVPRRLGVSGVSLCP